MDPSHGSKEGDPPHDQDRGIHTVAGGSSPASSAPCHWRGGSMRDKFTRAGDIAADLLGRSGRQQGKGEEEASDYD
jgi:hypothetical protein